jgi:hypothetical protein
MAHGPYVMYAEGGWDTIERPAGFPICKPYGSHTGSDAPRTPQMETVERYEKLTFERMQKLWSILRREWSLRGGRGSIGIGTSGDPDIMVTAEDIQHAFKTTLAMYEYDVSNRPKSWDDYMNSINLATDYSNMESAGCDGNPTYCVIGVSHGKSTSDTVTYFSPGSPEGTVKYRPWGNNAMCGNDSIVTQWQYLFRANVSAGDSTLAEFFNTYLVGAANQLSNTCVCNCNYCTCFGDEVCNCHVVHRSGWCYAYIY